MTPAEIRRAFEAGFEPSPGLENRVVNALPAVPPRRPAAPPRWAMAAIAVVLVAALTASFVWLAHGIPTPKPVAPPAGDDQALSLGAFSSPSDGWVVRRDASRAELLQTSTGGATWTERLRFPDQFFDMRWSPDHRTGVVFAIDMGAPNPNWTLHVFRTTDGGLHWKRQPVPGWSPRSVYFLDGTRGWVLTEDRRHFDTPLTLYRTVDGGASWTAQGQLADTGMPPAMEWGSGINNLYFTNDRDGWYVTRASAVGRSNLWATRDGGLTWSEQAVVLPPAVAADEEAVQQPVVFPGGAAILPVVLHAKGAPDSASPDLLYLYSSTDGGATWTDPRPMFPAGSPQENVRPIGDFPVTFFLDASHWWVSTGDNVPDNPQVLITADGGRTWRTCSRAPRLLRLWFTDPLQGWAEDITGPHDTNGLLRTTDGGVHWTRVDVPPVS